MSRFGASGVCAALLVLIGIVSPMAASASTPVVATTISVVKTGSEPFDGSTWDSGTKTNAGLDESEDNNVVRLQDTVTYQVETSVNDAAVDNLVVEVLADKKERWIRLPDECRSDGTPVSAIVDSSGSGEGDQRLMICNLGTAVEGTNRVLYPVARVIAASYDGSVVTLNDHSVEAEVAAWASGESGTSDRATDGPVSTVVTAGFEVNLIKTLKSTALDDEGNPLYRPYFAYGPNGERGTVMQYVISAVYQNGSMVVDSDEVSFLEDFSLIDYYSDDNPNNNGAVGSNAVLYDWGPKGSGCNLVGDHGASAAVTCSPSTIVADLAGPSYGPDGINDHVLDVELSDIDVRDPDGDGNLFEIDVELWYEHATELETDPSCSSGICEIFAINGVGVYDAATNGSVGFNPVSTEDASETNLPNYRGEGEPHGVDNWADYNLVRTSPGSWSPYLSFNAEVSWSTPAKADTTLKLAPGETGLVGANIWDYRTEDTQQSQHCTKIDTTKFEYQGFSAAPAQTAVYGYNRRTINPSLNLWGPGLGTKVFEPGDDLVFLYSAEPNDTLADLRDDVCEDDVNGDGTINIVDADGVQSTPGAPVDWYTNAEDMPGGLPAIAKIRYQYTKDKAALQLLYPDSVNLGIGVNYDVAVRSDVTAGYGSKNLLSIYSAVRRTETDGSWGSWISTADGSIDPEEASFSYLERYADRAELVLSGQGVSKKTLPRGIKVVEAGETTTFEIAPRVFGRWDAATQNTAEVRDNLPAQTPFVFGSERFSVDGGLNWMTFTQYQDSDPDVELTLAGSAVGANGHSVGADPLQWNFSDIDVGENLPLIRYDVRVKSSVTSGKFVNTVRLVSDMAIDADEDGELDPAWSTYQLSMEAGAGFDVLKSVGENLAEADGEINFDLLYKNLGLENYSAGSFIDVLPFVGDDSVAGGTDSQRAPGSDFSGTFEVARLAGSNGETFFATDRNPTEISTDPCHSSNLAAGEVPAVGDLCFTTYSRNGSELPDGETAGTGATEWVECTATDPVACGSIDPADMTAIRFDTGAISAAGGGHTVTVTLDADGNVGGKPAITGDGTVTAESTGDIYTNNFGGRIPEISLPVLSNDVTVTVVSGSIGDRVWLDTNGDGVQDAGESGVEGITVRLLAEDPDSPGTFVARDETVTGADGDYSFDNLPSGRYKIEVVPSGPLATVGQTYDYDGAGDSASIRDLWGPNHPDAASGLTAQDYGDVENVVDQDFGYDPTPGSIGDRVWYDLNADGIQDPGETGIAGVKVTVTGNGLDGIAGTDDDINVTVTTDANGDYLVEDLPLGEHVVFVDPSSLPEGLEISGDPDSVLDGGAQVELTSAEAHHRDADFGYSGSGKLGDTVWLDLNGDGIHDAGEPGIGGVEVTVTANGPDGVAGTDDDYSKTVVTDANGQYLVEGLLADDYTVTVNPDTLPAGVNPTFDADGGLDSVSETTLATNDAEDLDQDFGYVGPGQIGDTIFLDTNGDGIEDPDEDGIAGVSVTVTGAGADGLFGTDDDFVIETVTDADGKYLVEGLPTGDYTVEVDPSTLPVGVDTQTADPDDALDHVSAVTLTEAEPVNLDQDFGYQGDGALGSIVWLDVNADGVQDESEPGLAGVEVTAVWAGPDGIAGTGDDIEFVTHTDDDGAYRFDELPFGDYTVTTDLSDWVPTYDATGAVDQTSVTSLSPEAPADLDQNFGFTGPGSVGDVVWLDPDGDGIRDGDEPGLAGVDVVVTWAGPDGIAGTDDDIAYPATTDVDGYFLVENLPLGDYTVAVDTSTLPPELSNTFDLDGNLDSISNTTLTGAEPDDMNHEFGYMGPGSLGDTVWTDTDGDGIQDAGEPGISGVAVTAVWAGPDGVMGTDDDERFTTTTDASGHYEFSGLPLGDYDVTVAGPSGQTQTGDPDGTMDSSTRVSLTAEQPSTDEADFGFRVAPATVTASGTVSTSGAPSRLAYSGSSTGLLVALAALLTVGGAALLATRRRQQEA